MALVRGLITSAQVEVESRNHEAALPLIREVFLYVQEGRVRRHLDEELEVLAFALAQLGRFEAAARALGASDGAIRRESTMRFPNRTNGYDGLTSLLRDRLGEERFESLWRDGFALEFDPCVAFALAELQQAMA